MDTKRFAGEIGPEDYEEPRCPLCMEKPGDEAAVHSIDMRRVTEKLDEYMSRKDYGAAERHLDFWLGEARLGNDKRGEFSVWNERMGFFRKTQNEEKAFEAAEKALALVPVLGYENAISGATCYINSGTVFEAFGKPERALPLFEDAKRIYEQNLSGADPRLGGLYNNMALCYVANKRFGEAHRCYKMALDVMGKVPGGSLEQAITYLNMANAVEDEHGLEKGEKKIGQLLDLAEDLLNRCDPDKDEGIAPGYYAFVCEKCAPTFDYYGYFLTAKKLLSRADEITKSL